VRRGYSVGTSPTQACEPCARNLQIVSWRIESRPDAADDLPVHANRKDILHFDKIPCGDRGDVAVVDGPQGDIARLAVGWIARETSTIEPTRRYKASLPTCLAESSEAPHLDRQTRS
jgi:hypothetical protein